MSMGYAKDDDGNVVLTMTQKDWDIILLAMGYFIAGWTQDNPKLATPLFEWANRINAGNLNFTPYKVERSEEPR